MIETFADVEHHDILCLAVEAISTTSRAMRLLPVLYLQFTSTVRFKDVIPRLPQL